MKEKNFTSLQKAQLRRTAVNVFQYIAKREKLEAKKALLQEEIEDLNATIELMDGPTIHMTGFKTEDLFIKEKDSNGMAKFTFKYPETIIPVQENQLPEPPQEVVFEDMTESEESSEETVLL